MAGVMTIDDVYAALEDLRARRPLVQNITNYVAMTVSANVLLALGASPAMVHAAEEVEDFIAISDALAVNIGTLSPPWVDAMRLTVKRAIALGKPWVLDPVGCGATGGGVGAARRLRRGDHRRDRLCQRRDGAGRRAQRPRADAVIDRARLLAQRGERGLYRGAAAAPTPPWPHLPCSALQERLRRNAAAGPVICRRKSATRCIAWTTRPSRATRGCRSE